MARPAGSLGRTDLRFAARDISELELERTIRAVQTLWLRGYGVKDIAEELRIDYADVLKIIKGSRAQFREWHQDELLNLAAERIEGFRRIQQQIWFLMGKAPRQSSSLLAILQRCEENIAKIQGVLTDRVLHLGSVDVNHKLYDFRDTLPPALEAQIIEAEARATEDAYARQLLEPVVVEGEVVVGEPEARTEAKVFWKKNLPVEIRDPQVEPTAVDLEDSPALGNLETLLKDLVEV